MKSQAQVRQMLARVKRELTEPVRFMRQVHRLSGWQAALEWVLADPLPKDIKAVMSKQQTAIRLKAIRKK